MNIEQTPLDPARRVVNLDGTDGHTSQLSDTIDLLDPVKTPTEVATALGGTGKPYYRGIRVDVAGAVKFDYLTNTANGTNSGGAIRATGVRNIAAGEVLLYPILRVWSTGTAATGIDGIL